VNLSLVVEANSLVDSFAAVLDYTFTAHQGRIKPEEAKALPIRLYPTLQAAVRRLVTYSTESGRASP
jgi:hypothetical protein